MATGTVKWFNTTKGYGFIQPDDGGADVFVHISAVERSGLGSVREGQKLAYELEKDRKSGKFAAGALKAIMKEGWAHRGETDGTTDPRVISLARLEGHSARKPWRKPSRWRGPSATTAARCASSRCIGTNQPSAHNLLAALRNSPSSPRRHQGRPWRLSSSSL